jgi:hypothetical protein
LALAESLLMMLAAAAAKAVSPAEASFAIERPEALAGRILHGNLPLVRASIAGKEALFLLDTGSSDTVLTESFATAVSLESGTALAGQDSGGHAVKGHRAGPIEARFDQGRVVRTIMRVSVIPLPPLEALGLAGVISPQTLVGDGCVSVDFPVGIVTLASAEAPGCRSDVRDAGDAHGDWAKNGRPYIDVRPAIDDQRSVSFLLDSGASRTRIPQDFAVNPASTKWEAGQGVAGIVTGTAIVGAVRLRIGRQGITVDAPGLATKAPSLGFDVLRRARLTLHAGGAMEVRFSN